MDSVRRLLPALPLLLLLALGVAPGVAAAAWQPAGADLSRPRVLYRPGDEDAIRARLGREPYRSWFVRIHDQLGSSAALPLADDTIAGERIQSNHAKHAAFLYALDRTLVGGQPAPFPSLAARQAMGDRARDLLLTMYGRSRIPAQFDDDINSSEEMINYATAYDLLAGAGYDFAGSEPAIRARLVAFASEFYSHFLYPDLVTSNPFETTDKLVNNHLSKSASALGVAAIVLAEHTPAPGSDPARVGDPADWMAWALERLDTVLRFTFVTGDGGYAEGPYYQRYAAQNHLPFLRALDRLAGPGPFPARGGVSVPNLWRDPLFARLQRWLVDHTLPDGSLAPLDDGNPGKSYYFALLSHLPGAPLHHWMAARTLQPFESEGSIYLSADMIVAHDDGIVPTPPQDGEARFYPEGGSAVFRSAWTPDAVMAIANAEHGAALELGRDRHGRGQTGSASHEHNEPGSFLLHAFGERLVLDPGYLTFPERALVAKPEDHGIVLVDGQGPKDPFIASIVWAFEQPDGLSGPAPVDGEASLTQPLDTGFLDAAHVVTRYGTPAARFERAFLFPDHRYLVAADTIDGRTGSPRTFTWLLHGNGGGDSDGGFLALPLGGRWTRGAARLDALFAAAGATPAFATSVSNHEDRPNELRTHAVLRASVTAPDARSVLVAYPSRASSAAPTAAAVAAPGAGAVALFDPAEDRRLLALHRAGGLPLLTLDVPGLRRLETDGALALVDARADGALRLAFAEEASELAYDGLALRAGARGRLGLRPEATRAEIVSTAPGVEVEVSGLAFDPQAADGACALAHGAGGVRVRPGRDGVVVLRADAGNSAPSADPGPTRGVWPGAPVTLAATASCDLDGDALAARWEVVSAPAGSAGILRDADSLTPTLRVDVAGPYRLRLVVTDARGAASRPADLLVAAGPQCGNGLDDDLDGLFDAVDDRCAASGGSSECGLLGIEGALGAAIVLGARRRIAAAGALPGTAAGAA